MQADVKPTRFEATPEKPSMCVNCLRVFAYHNDGACRMPVHPGDPRLKRAAAA
jgi:hypothetical protein